MKIQRDGITYQLMKKTQQKKGRFIDLIYRFEQVDGSSVITMSCEEFRKGLGRGDHTEIS